MRAALLALAACGAKPPPPPAVANTGGESHSKPQRYPWFVSPPRPQIDFSSILPDPTEEPRWPLPASVHPVLAPQFAISSALAAPGIDWSQLCAMGAQNRRIPGAQDLTDYLHAWCDASQHDVPAAIRGLTRLEQTTTLGLASALPIDCANILADAGSADDAEKTLGKVGVTDDASIYDALSATYFEVGKLHDAYEIADLAIQAGTAGAAPARCHRLAKSIVIAKQLGFGPAAKVFDELGRHAEPACVHLQRAIWCWLDPGSGCREYLIDQGLDLRYEQLLRAVYRWPRNAPAEDWIDLARNILPSWPIPGVDETAVAALEAAYASSQCGPRELDAIVELAGKMGVTASSPLMPRIDALRALTIASCTATLGAANP